jgi:hypothetical protein
MCEDIRSWTMARRIAYLDSQRRWRRLVRLRRRAWDRWRRRADALGNHPLALQARELYVRVVAAERTERRALARLRDG